MLRAVNVSTLYYGDNLDVLREHVPDDSIDLVYLDPPFNSARGYNVLFAEHDVESEAQIRAFEDTWKWDTKAERTYKELTDTDAEDRGVPAKLVTLTESLRAVLGTNDMFAYLVMMAIRLVELRRVLKPTGSLYLHCDPTASHYLKILLDVIFGAEQFRDEIIWKRADTVKGNFGQGSRFFDRNTDSILFFAKSGDNAFHPVFTEYTAEYIGTSYKHVEPNTGRRYQLISMTGPGGAAKGNPEYEVMGVTRYWRYSRVKMQELIDAGLVVQTSPGSVPRRKLYLDEGKGVPVQSLWDDIPALHSQAAERLGYPTQKPVALLERIVAASSKEGDVVLDPFCGCGTTIDAAQRLKREWIGIDITHLAISLIRSRLNTAFPGIKYDVRGEPADIEGALALAEADKYQFQWWALHLVGARPMGGDGGGREGKKGMDRGIDGTIRFRDDPRADKSQRILVSVKAGANLNPGMVRDLRGTIEREGAPIGVFLTMHEPTAEMRTEATRAGMWRSPTWNREYPRVQIITIAEAFAGKRVDYPGEDVTLQTAPVAVPKTEQLALGGAAPTPAKPKRRKR